MKNFIFAALLLATSSFADLKREYPTQKLLDAKTPIVDIRTPMEWRETGLLKGSIPIMFFNEQGKFNINGFLKELNEKVDTSKEFAIICRTASRTKVVSDFLSNQLNYKVIDLEGGVVYAKSKNLPFEPYKVK
ncbi:MAG: rhodanese-like domain-containing protein [Campylobacterales bacterium]|nr:rhodanese-like domain-containing protein [Campylobacterales bacterium]